MNVNRKIWVLHLPKAGRYHHVTEVGLLWIASRNARFIKKKNNKIAVSIFFFIPNHRVFLINQLFLASWGRVWKFRVRRNSMTNGRVWHCSGSHQLVRCWGQNWCGWKHDHKVHLWLWILNLLSFLAEEAALKACCSWYITYRFFSFSVLFGDDDRRPPVYWGPDAGAFMHLE